MMLMKGEDDQHNDNANDGDYDQGNSNYKKGNKSDKSDHPHQREPWCFVEVAVAGQGLTS